MVQDILTYISVGGAFIYIAISFTKIIYNSFINEAATSCGGGCSGCSAKDELLRDIKDAPDFNNTKWKLLKKQVH